MGAGPPELQKPCFALAPCSSQADRISVWVCALINLILVADFDLV